MTKVEEMWTALAAYQPQAVAAGHGPSWARMCKEKTVDAAAAAAAAANAAAAAAVADAVAYAAAFATAAADADAYAAYAAAAAAANAAAAAADAAATAVVAAAADAAAVKKWAQRAIDRITKVLVKPAPVVQKPAPVQKPEHLQQGVDALVSAAGTALEVLEKHRQIKGEAPMGMLGVRAMEELKEALGLLYPRDDYEPPAQPAVQEPCGWQFYQDGKWHNGMETSNHRANTEAAGIPVRDVYPSPHAAPVQEQALPEFYAQLEYNLPDWDVFACVYRRRADATPELVHREQLPRQAPTAQPAPEQYTALEQALTRLQKRYAELEAKVAAQRQWVGLTNDEVNDFAAGCHLGNSVQGTIYKAEAKLKEKNT